MFIRKRIYPNRSAFNIPPFHRMEDCSICFEALTASTGHCTLGCSHTFHLACIARWTNHSSSSCPLCRKELSETERIVKPEPDLPDLEDQVPSRNWTNSIINMLPRRMMFTLPARSGQSMLDNLNDLIHMTEVPINIGDGITVSEADIKIVMERANVSRSLAVRKLRENDGNVAETIYDLNREEPESRLPSPPPHDPLEPTDEMVTAWALERLFSKGTLLDSHGYASLEHVHYRTSQTFRYGFWVNPDYRNIPKKRRADSL